jgi:HEPN domain-containing protein
MLNNVYSNLEEARRGTELDDAYFDIACYDAQQAIEFILKAILLEYEVDFPTSGTQGHSILWLYELIHENTDFAFDKESELELLSETITHWEVKGRYHEGIKTREDTVRRVLNIYKAIEKSYMELICKNSVENS